MGARGRAHRADVDGDIKEARRFGLGGNPVYTVNGTPLSGVHDLRRFRRLIDVELGFSTTRRVDG
jgi:protein-disulfide isomerase